MLRNFYLVEAAKYQSADLTTDENEELANTIKEYARKWAGRVFKKLPEAIQTTVDKGLDMRLDHIDSAYKADLIKGIEKCAQKKLKEFEKDRAEMAGSPHDEGAEQPADGAPEHS